MQSLKRESLNQTPITNHQSPITNHQSPITNQQSAITIHPITD
jgi:DNA polymerase-3 subunit gamma/tau